MLHKNLRSVDLKIKILKREYYENQGYEQDIFCIPIVNEPAVISEINNKKNEVIYQLHLFIKIKLNLY